MSDPRHSAAAVREGGRYPFRPSCSCGWSGAWGYLTEAAARGVADDHAALENWMEEA